ncbi:FAD-binding oxidoreductase [Caenimonas sedimenti]|uniref:FAD-binding oxidoreductase n=1 Tax=Caenimonas sedimenti TaxID=2596921 RepID=A0A562ZY15_9BURK|nr:FAD-binding oxidoreductase [Caenimonas sedimenti]TWO73281.1 FAD-binding oxidoreductase [Caenimonas sedimenti]
MNAPTHPIEQLQIALPDLDWVTDTNRIARLSQDFSWFSPVLKRQLTGKTADCAVRPRNEDEIKRLVSLCARLRVPITIRGTGTGNYGQSVPLQGGVVLDMSGFNQFLWARNGAGRAQAGMRLSEFEKEARNEIGMELRCMPSTYRSATLGGLFGGGFGGVGSINYGPLGARGNVLGVKAITIEEEPKIVELRGPEALMMHHMWGTNGLVLELELALAPAVPWQEHLVVFDSFDDALEFGNAVALAPGIVKREVAFFAAPVPDYLKQLAEHLRPGCHAVLLAIAPESEPAMLELSAQWRGWVSYSKSAEEIARTNRTLLEYTWNHTTLVAFKTDKTITYLQSAFIAGQHLEQVRRMEKLLAPEVQMHCEFIRNMDGLVTCTALQIVKFTTEERLQEIMQIHRDNGVRINDPHVFVVEDGKAGGLLPPASHQIKRRFDPLNLLNPGKVRAWTDGVPD